MKPKPIVTISLGPLDGAERPLSEFGEAERTALLLQKKTAYYNARFQDDAVFFIPNEETSPASG